MDLVTIGPTFPFRGGIALYTTQLVGHLRQRHRVTFFSFRRQYPRWLFPGSTLPDPSRSQLIQESSPTIDGINPLTWWRTGRLIRDQRPDLLLLQWWTPFWLPMMITVVRHARAAQVPIVTLVHQFIEPDSSFPEWFLARRALRLSDGLIVMTEQDCGLARRVFPATPVRLGPLPLFQHDQRQGLTRSAARQLLGVDDAVPLLLFFGFVRRYKGLRVLLRALAELPEIHLLVAGEFWENESTYRAEVDRLGLASRVTIDNRYVGNEEVERYFVAADALVLPYLAASQSAVAMTALSFALPIIATTVGGLPEIVRPGATGLLVEPGDSAGLAAAIAKFFGEQLAPSLQTATGQEAEQLSWSSLVRVIEEISSAIGADATAAGS